MNAKLLYIENHSFVHNYSSFTIVIIPFSFHIVNNIFQMKLKYNFIEIYIDFKVKSVMIYV